ncbi:hypothetical protein OsccyDRAFT_2589 [Leptolyngbyaceae cyanobacterium JSC-12]|nr:hypothetical protein OsccyDRAFT_2589 [Leptolyngbyaceae cyanobacterium JSC-12]
MAVTDALVPSHDRSSRQWVSDRWIVNQRYDLCFFIGSCILTLGFLGFYHLIQQVSSWNPDHSILLTYFIFTAFFDQPHIFQTFSRTHFDQLEFKKRKPLHTWGLFSLIGIGFLVTGLGREADLIVFAAVFGSYHIIRQHYGFLKAYKNLNRDRHRIDDWLDFGVFNMGMFACFFNDYTEIGGPIVIYQDLQSYFPELPPVFVEVTWSLFLFFLFLFVARQVHRLITGLPINLPKILFLAATLSTHYLVYFATTTPFLVAEALETAYHDVQYQGWMMHYQTQRFPHIRQVAIQWFSAAMVYGMVVGIVEIVGLGDRGWGMWLFVPFTMIVLYHYLVDGLIWKFSQQPELRALLFGKHQPTSVKDENS